MKVTEQEKSNGAFLPKYLSAKHLQPFIYKELCEKLDSAVFYIAGNLQHPVTKRKQLKIWIRD